MDLTSLGCRRTEWPVTFFKNASEKNLKLTFEMLNIFSNTGYQLYYKKWIFISDSRENFQLKP